MDDVPTRVRNRKLRLLPHFLHGGKGTQKGWKGILPAWVKKKIHFTSQPSIPMHIFKEMFNKTIPWVMYSLPFFFISFFFFPLCWDSWLMQIISLDPQSKTLNWGTGPTGKWSQNSSPVLCDPQSHGLPSTLPLNTQPLGPWECIFWIQQKSRALWKSLPCSVIYETEGVDSTAAQLQKKSWANRCSLHKESPVVVENANDEDGNMGKDEW